MQEGRRNDRAIKKQAMKQWMAETNKTQNKGTRTKGAPAGGKKKTTLN